MMAKVPYVSIVLPCRNEAAAIGICINQIKQVLVENDIDGEIIVSDSSKAKSPIIANELGAKVVIHEKIGYGNAFLEGLKYAKGKFIIMGDADGTYDFRNIPLFLRYLEKGYDVSIPLEKEDE